MKKQFYIITYLILLSTNTYAEKEDFWGNCPGPACPSNTPIKPLDNYNFVKPPLNNRIEIDELKKQLEALKGKLDKLNST